jgi:hypothetical protein
MYLAKFLDINLFFDFIKNDNALLTRNSEFILEENNEKQKINMNSNLTGPSYGRPGVNYTFCIEYTDPEGDEIYSLWDWGDSNITEWLGSYASGESICAEHAWYQEGLFLIRVKIKDEYGNESNWFEHEILIEGKEPFVELNRPKRAIYINNRIIAPFLVPLIIGDIQLWFWAEDEESGLDYVELYIDNELRETFSICPKSWDWNDNLFLKHEIKIIAYDKAGNTNILTRNVWKFF